MSIFLILIQIYVLRLIFKKNFPGLLVYYCRNIKRKRFIKFHTSYLKNSYSLISLVALIVIFVRASSQIKIKIFDKKFSYSLLGVLPGCLEIISTILLCSYLTPLNLYESLMLGFIITAVSPAVVVPSMIELQNKNWGKK